MKRILAIVVLVISILGTQAQTNNYQHCATMQMLEEQKLADPGLQARMDAIEQATNEYIKNHGNQKQSSVITIPVVFHILWNVPAENISDSRILAQLDVLNKDFARLNADANNTPSVFQGVAVNTQIQFCLAQRDPNGAATTGILRIQTTKTSFSSSGNPIKFTAQGGSNAWPASSYLNFWVGNLGGGLLGYAQFPGGTANTDGVVCLYTSVGGPSNPGTGNPYHLGRTATHEVGHWLNLFHIWGDANCGNDQVSDTPTQQTSNFGCPTFPHVTCANGPNGDMFMNYMDYVDDGCMNMFTAGQSTRMNAALAGPRVGLTTSLGCSPVGGCGTPSGLSSSGVSTSSVYLGWSLVSGAVSYNIRYRIVGAANWINTTSTTTSTALTGLTPGSTYEYQIQAVCSNSTGAYSASANFTTLTSGCGLPGSLTALNVQATSASITWLLVGGATSYKVQYRVLGTSTYTTKTATTSPYNLSGLTPSTTYQYRVRAVCGATLGNYTTVKTFTTQAGGGGGCTGSDPYEPNELASTAATISPNTDAYGIISTATDVDFYKITATNAAPKIKVILDGLPADYDVKLSLGSTGALIATSQNSGTTPEQIIYNTPTAGAVYKVKVYGYNGAFVPTSCYHLRVSTSATNWREGGDFVQVENTNGMFLYPNPAKDLVTVELFCDKEQTSSINVVDMLGRSVLSLQQDLNEGNNQLNLDLSKIQKGMYTVRASMNGQLMVKTLVVQ